MNSRKNIFTKTYVAKKKKGSFIKKLWDKHVKRLDKITNDKPQCCANKTFSKLILPKPDGNKSTQIVFRIPFNS
jgi:hypothetical protein